MGTAGDLGSHQRVLRLKDSGIHLFQRIPSQIVVSIARGSQKTGLTHICFLHGSYHLELIVFCIFVDLRKTSRKRVEYLLTKTIHFVRNAKSAVQFSHVRFHKIIFPFHFCLKIFFLSCPQTFSLSLYNLHTISGVLCTGIVKTLVKSAFWSIRFPALSSFPPFIPACFFNISNAGTFYRLITLHIPNNAVCQIVISFFFTHFYRKPRISSVFDISLQDNPFFVQEILHIIYYILTILVKSGFINPNYLFFAPEPGELSFAKCRVSRFIRYTASSREISPSQIKEFTPEKTNSSGIRLQSSLSIFYFPDIGKDINPSAVTGNIIFSF